MNTSTAQLPSLMLINPTSDTLKCYIELDRADPNGYTEGTSIIKPYTSVIVNTFTDGPVLPIKITITKQ